MFNNNLHFHSNQLQILDALNKGKTVSFIDYEGEFATFAKKLGGKTIVIDENEKNTNPLNTLK